MNRIKEKNVIVTGGARGIGYAIAEKFALEGANIILNDFCDQSVLEESAKNLQATAKQNGHSIRTASYRFDVSNFEASKEGIDVILKDFTKVDILINNAGITKDKLVMQMTEADFDSVIGVNLKGSFNMIRHLYRNFMANRSGSIINIASVVGLMGSAGQANYSAAKAGVVGLTKTVARELGGRGITVNAIAPGFIETAMTAVLSDEVKQKYFELIPLKRGGTAEEVAHLALFLATAGYITGEVVKIDGGLYI
ncbi:MAG: 3-oxoacyl-ACP reductase FabG [Firmicutes bacterium]|nr:3-oxoacyl-ACP reductase FabG [Bacillota bacterium]